MSATHTLGLVQSPIGIAALVIFIAASAFVVLEERLHLRKSKPVMLAAAAIWALIAWHASTEPRLGTDYAATAFRHAFLEFSELFFFLIVAMSFVAAMGERNVFETLRARLNEKWGRERGHLTLLTFLVRAIVLAVREFPMVNARFDDEAGVLTRYDAVHAGIATQTPAGLVVPVVRDAHANDLWANAAEIARLADAARSGKAVRAELSGSTITITSLGKLGGIVTTPVINHPEVAIVGVNKIAARPVIRDGAVAARQLMNLSSSFDHRVVDGADAAAFIQSVRRYVEQPAMLFVE